MNWLLVEDCFPLVSDGAFRLGPGQESGLVKAFIQAPSQSEPTSFLARETRLKEANLVGRAAGVS